VAKVTRKYIYSHEQPLDKLEIEGIDLSVYRSNPALSAPKSLNSDQNKHFFEGNTKAWHQVALRFPYKLARLIHHDGDLSKRWYVVFYAYDVSVEKVRRIRLFDPINRKKTVRERMEIAEEIIRDVNADLRAGKVLGKDKLNGSINTKTSVDKMKLCEGFAYFVEQKKINKNERSYFRRFTTLQNHIEAWYKKWAISDIPLRQLNNDRVLAFFDYLKSVGLKNKTFNNYRTDFGTVLNYLSKKKPGLFKFNLIENVDILPVVTEKHAAYNDEQIKAIQKACIELDQQQLLLYIQFIYYTLARPKNLLHLKVVDIEIDKHRIKIKGKTDKNKTTEYVSISPQFKQIILQNRIQKYNPDDYVFGLLGTPGPNRIKTVNTFWKRNLKVLKSLGYYQENSNYTLYSFKHSGVISLYNATKDIKLVQRQCRHKTLDQTNTYLRDLDLLTDHEALKEWKGAF
jgi:integrase